MTYLNLKGLGITHLSFSKKQVTATFADGNTKDYDIQPPYLRRLNCSHNQLTKLENLPKKLIRLDCPHNQLTLIKDLPESLIELYCPYNNLTKLENLSRNLKVLDCSDNKLTKLQDFPRSLRTLFCSNNELTRLENLPKLEILGCGGNPLRFVEPLPHRPQSYSVPSIYHSVHSYKRYYSSYKSHRQTSEFLMTYLALEMECSYPILDPVKKHYRDEWEANPFFPFFD